MNAQIQGDQLIVLLFEAYKMKYFKALQDGRHHHISTWTVM